MATQQTSAAARVLVAPSVILLFLWMIVPLAMTLYFSSLRYSLLDAENIGFVGFQNYAAFLSDPDFLSALVNTLVLVGSVLVISVGGGILVALLMDQPVFGQNALRLMVIAPFFVMPTVSALVWKNLLMNPDSGLFAWIARSLGMEPVVWFTNHPMMSVVIVVSWEWLPFASLILLTALQSLDEEQKEAAQLDGAGALPYFFYIVLPHIARAITVVILIETIFLLSVFAEIYVTTGGGPGVATTNIPFLVYKEALLNFDVGAASAGGIVAVILANIVAIFLMRIVGRNLEG
ncbi:sorbitol ABC transporter membrane protein /mannitol ABC transporter membrane protein [Roseiarcus fermentans]|uniref:Sorbitol ABC transporter membrane protein /mannitol ABC transporter membrane protein n=1 Tax=Roseiarcus fermentans TaxID=1473586 RepID=A0A366FQX4_9HYPH|nr:sugar ABC transporter permease [Roseiarcus fermentans]RBP16125.1 sorbitol ABC transporter membrane protein /mannitol ABC transporter membrane protein [Roseiarcus fermentans]